MGGCPLLCPASRAAIPTDCVGGPACLEVSDPPCEIALEYAPEVRRGSNRFGGDTRMVGIRTFAAVVVLLIAASPIQAQPVLDSVKGTFSSARDGFPELCSCGNGKHVDPVCAFALNAATCIAAFELVANGTCQCLPDKLFQLSHFTTHISVTTKSDARDKIATLLAQLLRQAVRSALIIDSVDTGGTLFFQQFSATDGSNQVNTQAKIRNALLQFASSNIAAHVAIQNKDFGPAGIDAELGVSPNGKEIFAHGPIECPAGQRVSPLHVTVTQEAIGAIAHGSWSKDCTGTSQQWNLKAHKGERSNPFVPGSAEVCAWAVFKLKNSVQTTKQWCADVVLSEVPK